jgi:thiamine biosynthesis protein ThiS
MTITLNGERREVQSSATIAAILELLAVNPRYVAVEVNRRLIPRQEHITYRIEPGDSIEVVTLVGGG